MALERSIPHHHVELVRVLRTVETTPLAIECLKWSRDRKGKEQKEIIRLS